MVSHAVDNANGHQNFDVYDALDKLGVETNPTCNAPETMLTAILRMHFPKQVLVDQSDQDAWRKQLWSLHQQVAKPRLIFKPTSAKEVAIAILLCRVSNFKFAVKSGGHAAMPGASSSDGLVIDLQNLNAITLNEDKTIAGIGAGNRWEHIFEELAKHGLAVAGGRAGDVGVGGYTTGGGISFFASARGWACDNVRNYELVTCEGEILNVNYKSYPDLFWALRGGGANFGIVTRFDYETFPQGDIYAGTILIDYAHKDAVIDTFTRLAHDSDPKSATWLVAVHHQGREFFSALAMHADPTPDFEILKAYSKLPAIHQSHKVRSVADMTREIAEQNVQGHYQNYQNTTFKFDVDFVYWLVDMYMREVAPVQSTYESKQPTVVVMQCYTKEMISHMGLEGGNCLPLEEDEAPYLNFLTPSAWMHEKDTELVMGVVSRIHQLAREEAAKRGILVDYIYMNYASYTQDAMKGYGKNAERLKKIAKKYDPEGVFQKLMPGYFKFGGSPQELSEKK